MLTASWAQMQLDAASLKSLGAADKPALERAQWRGLDKYKLMAELLTVLGTTRSDHLSRIVKRPSWLAVVQLKRHVAEDPTFLEQVRGRVRVRVRGRGRGRVEVGVAVELGLGLVSD